jgi:hypothetical protein
MEFREFVLNTVQMESEFECDVILIKFFDSLSLNNPRILSFEKGDKI